MPDDDKPPLPYRNYLDDRPERKANIRAMIAGVSATFVFGCLNTLAAVHPDPSMAAIRFKLVIIFGCVAIATGCIGFLVLRGEPRRFMLGGFLLGISLASIIEGVCFFG